MYIVVMTVLFQLSFLLERRYCIDTYGVTPPVLSWLYAVRYNCSADCSANILHSWYAADIQRFIASETMIMVQQADNLSLLQLMQAVSDINPCWGLAVVQQQPNDKVHLLAQATVCYVCLSS